MLYQLEYFTWLVGNFPFIDRFSPTRLRNPNTDSVLVRIQTNVSPVFI